MPKKKTTAKPAPAASTTQPPADTPALPGSAQTVLAQLDAENGKTAAEVAESSGLGRSTVTKALSTLLDAGLAVRQDGGHEGSRPIAARWFAAPAEHDTEDHTADLSQEADAHDGLVTAAEPLPDNAENQEAEPEPVEEPAGDEGADGGDEPTTDAVTDDQSATVPTATPDETDPVETDSGPDNGQAATDDASGTAEDTPDTAEHDGESAQPIAEPSPDPVSNAGDEEPAPVADAEPGPARLGKGELRAQVEDHLRGHPDRAWTPSAIAKVLNRSAGAINNACEKLLETEAVTTFDDKPRRFQWRGDQDASAV